MKDINKTPKLRFPEFKEEWQNLQLKDIFEKISNKNKDFKLDLIITNSAEFGLIKQTDFFEREITTKSNLNNYFIIQKGDFVYNPRKSKLAPFGPFNRLERYEEGIISPLYICIKLVNNNINSDFLKYYLLSSKWHEYIRVNGSKGARYDRVNMTNRLFNSIPINITSYKEQEKISSFLSAIDKKIELKEKEFNCLKDYKNLLLQEIFEKKSPTFLKNCKWKKQTLSSLGCFIRGHSYKSINVVDNGLLVLRSSNIFENNITFDDLQFVNKPCKENILLKDNDIIICMSNGSKRLVGKNATYHTNSKYPIVTVGAFCSIYRSQHKITKYLLQTNKYYDAISTLLEGTSINNLKNSLLEQLVFEIPKNQEDQIKIVEFLLSIDKKIELTKKQIDLTKKYKQCLLQQMFV